MFYKKTSEMTSKIDDVILAARNVSIVLSFFSRVSVAKLNFHANFCEIPIIGTLFFRWPIFALLGLTAVKIATTRGPRCARSNYFLRLMYVRSPNILIYEVSGRQHIVNTLNFEHKKVRKQTPQLCYWGCQKHCAIPH